MSSHFIRRPIIKEGNRRNLAMTSCGACEFMQSFEQTRDPQQCRPTGWVNTGSVVRRSKVSVTSTDSSVRR
jgi:hypothetical protein